LVERVVRIFDRFEDADTAEAANYAALSPAERVDILLDLNRPVPGVPR
jgi:hypothetical protein